MLLQFLAKISAVVDEMMSGDYDNVLQTCCKYFDVELLLSKIKCPLRKQKSDKSEETVEKQKPLIGVGNQNKWVVMSDTEHLGLTR